MSYTPFTEVVRRAFMTAYANRLILGMPDIFEEDEPAEAPFDRWLSAHDAEVRGKIAAEILDDLPVQLDQIPDSCRICRGGTQRLAATPNGCHSLMTTLALLTCITSQKGARNETQTLLVPLAGGNMHQVWRTPRFQLRKKWAEEIIDELDTARAIGRVYTYGAIQDLILEGTRK
jgi:hypothetical protein